MRLYVVKPLEGHRQQFSKEGLETLAPTIRQLGIWEPLVVRPGEAAGQYEMPVNGSGERLNEWA